ncbi:Nucleoporin [Halotydeus destructor]|nr:Nucleoporin [Halotydeus destructor]
MAPVNISCKKLWVLLSGTTLLKSNEEITQFLTTNEEKLTRGLLYYGKRSTDLAKETSSLKQICDSSASARFSQKLAAVLEIEAEKCYELLCSYLVNEYTGTVANLEVLFRSDRGVQSLVTDLSDFYYDECLYALFCMKQILSYWYNGSSHPYQKIFNAFVEKANANDCITDSIIEQMEATLKASLPENLIHGPSSSEMTIISWVNQNLKQRLEIAVLASLAYSKMNANVQQLTRIVSLILDHGGMRFSYSRQMLVQDHELQLTLNIADTVEALLIVELLQIKNLHSAIRKRNVTHNLLSVSDYVKQLDNRLVEANTGGDHYSIIFLSWIIVRRCWEELSIETESSARAIKRLSHECLTLNVFQYMRSFLSSEIFSNLFDGHRPGTVFKTIVAELISLFAVFFEVEELPDSDAAAAVYDLLSIVVKEDSIASSLFENSSDNGLQAIFNSTVLTFPLDVTPVGASLKLFLQTATQLAKTSSCLKLVKFVRKIDNFAEALDAASPVIQRIEDKCINAQSRNVGSVSVPRGASGKLLSYDALENVMFISWDTVEVNGWSILCEIYQGKIDAVTRGEHNGVNEAFLLLPTLMNQLCTEIVDATGRMLPDIQSLVEVACDSFKLFARFEPLNRRYISSMIDLFTSLCKLPSAFRPDEFWDYMSEFNLMPYMIGLRTSLSDLVSGYDTNSSLLGQTIASEECVQGEYSLCLAYLKFLSVNINKVKPSKSLGCLLHVFTEILPAHNRWRYKVSKQRAQITLGCFTLANDVLTMVQADERVLEICQHALLTGHAAEFLLRTIQSGKEKVANTIRQNGSSLLLANSEDISSVREALSLMNNLLRLQDKNPKPSVNLTTLEQALFESSSPKANMLVVLAHYVFQSYDPGLAALSAQILKKLSKRFPMSMLACLDNEVDAVRSHFLFRLDAVTEDVRVKIALLDFLTSCVKFQPGLMEIFVNSESDGKDDSTDSCLLTTLQILREKKDTTYFCPIELHIAAVRFLFAFWQQSHLLAIDQLLKHKDLWDLICFPIVKQDGSSLVINGREAGSDKLASYIFRLVAREMFLMKRLERKEISSDLKRVFEALPKTISAYSSYILKQCSLKALSKEDEHFALLTAWRDFTVSVAKFEPFVVNDELRCDIFMNLLRCLEKQLELKAKPVVLSLILDVCLMLFPKWSKSVTDLADADWQTLNTSIIYNVSEQKSSLSIGFLVSLNALMVHSVETMKKNGQDKDNNSKSTAREWMLPAVNLVMESMKLFQHSLLQEGSDVKPESRLALTSLSLLGSLVMFSSSDSQSWLPLISRNVLLESLSELLCSLIESRKGYDVAEAIMSTLLVFAIHPEASHLIQHAKVIDVLNVSLCKLYSATDSRSNHDWIHLYYYSFKLVTSVLLTVKQYFIFDALQFVKFHSERIRWCLTKLTSNPSKAILDEVVSMLPLVSVLLKYPHYCKMKEPQVLELFSKDSSGEALVHFVKLSKASNLRRKL